MIWLVVLGQQVIHLVVRQVRSNLVVSVAADVCMLKLSLQHRIYTCITNTSRNLVHSIHLDVKAYQCGTYFTISWSCVNCRAWT